ncbi:MAG: glycosyltransferase WbuB, partial [Gammaproteobacteria bacterium]|nr:glycosyltransferase WbuB [Gammaproteobacteria bacterium]NIO61299.1 glycosyltransferase WbuB [Gammaproteobacteria bacterium]NIT12791.1 glycosyltransferase WbuB [Candidatus Dadabacteria bacterium]NIT40891.1 glycosyltransferase WbuB [Gammaproteobacteria bacterium]
MKLLIISQYFWPETFRINDLALDLRQRGHEVTVLTGVPNYPSGKIYDGYSLFTCGCSEYSGVRVCHVPLLPRGKGRLWQLALNYLSFVFFSCLVGPFLCREKYDLIF